MKEACHRLENRYTGYDSDRQTAGQTVIQTNKGRGGGDV